MRTYILLISLFFISCADMISAPDIVATSSDGSQIFIVDKRQEKILVFDAVSLDKRGEISLGGEALALYPTHEALVVLINGLEGELRLYDNSSFEMIHSMKVGYSPSSVVKVGSHYWVTHRYSNELWRVDAQSGECRTLKVMREPIAVVSIANGERLLVANSLPHQRANGDKVAAALNIIDCESMSVIDTLYLPGGSTDVRSVICDNGGQYCYIPHTIARYQIPTNQLDRGWMTTSALTIFDLRSEKIVNSVLLDTPQRGAPGAWSGVVSPDNSRLYLTLDGTGELLTLSLTSLHNRLSRAERGEFVTPSMVSYSAIPNDAGFLYGIRDFIETSGKGARGITIADGSVIGTNYFTSGLYSVDLKDPILDVDAVDEELQREYLLKFKSPVLHATTLGTSLMTTAEGRGEAYFNDATLSFQRWQSCASCHPGGARTDGLNWDLLNDGMGNLKQTKSLLYAHRTPPAMVTGIRASAFVAVRSGFKYILFSPPQEQICEDIDSYLLSLEALPSPYLVDGELSEMAVAGRDIYEKECSSCHNGEYYTDMKSYNVFWTADRDKSQKMDTPTFRELWRTAPYLYDGRAETIGEVIDIHMPNIKINSQQREQLECYLMSL